MAAAALPMTPTISAGMREQNENAARNQQATARGKRPAPSMSPIANGSCEVVQGRVVDGAQADQRLARAGGAGDQTRCRVRELAASCAMRAISAMAGSVSARARWIGRILPSTKSSRAACTSVGTGQYASRARRRSAARSATDSGGLRSACTARLGSTRARRRERGCTRVGSVRASYTERIQTGVPPGRYTDSQRWTAVQGVWSRRP